MDDVIVGDHALVHGLNEEQIRYAWRNFIAKKYRGSPNEGQIVALGNDQQGKLMQIVAAQKPYGILIYHAMTPPTKKVLNELGMLRR